MERELRILVVEERDADASELLGQLSRLFPRAQTCRVRGIGDRFEETVARFAPDLVLTGVRFQEGDGVAVIRSLTGRTPPIPTIVVTTATDEDTAMRCYHAGAADYVVKDGLFRLRPAMLNALQRTRERAALAESEGRLREAEDRFRTIVEYSTNLFYTHSPDHVLTYVSPRTRDFLDCEPEEALVRWTEFLTDNPVNALGLERTERALRTGARQPPYELELRGKTGRMIWVEVHEAPVVRDGRTVAIVGALTDITARKRAEAALQRSEKSYRDLVEHAAYGIYRSAPDGRFLAANPALAEMLGYDSPEDVLAGNIESLYADPGERSRLMERYAGADRIVGVEVIWKRRDGRPVRVRLSGHPVHDPEGRIECFEMLVEDVTEQHALELQLRQAQRIQAIGQLTGGIAHDFNNELSVIILNAQLVAAAVEGHVPVQAADVREIQSAAQRAAAMTRKLLGFSRQADLTMVPTDLSAVVQRLAGTLRRVVPEYLELRVAEAKDVPAVRADVGAVEQMLLNLITNARDAMPDHGRLEIEVDACTLDEEFQRANVWALPGHYVRVSIADTGIGMSEEVRSRIFEPFFTTKPHGVGTGLGLAMVYGLIRQHRGYVTAESEPGRGTRMCLYFPVIAEAARELPARGSGERLRGGTETILLVEDEESLRRTAQRALERFGYRVLLASDGADALTRYRAEGGGIQLVISDLVMPRMSGWQLYQALRGEGATVPFILASGYGGKEAREREAIDPNLPFVQKPWSLEELLVRVRRELDRRRPGGR